MPVFNFRFYTFFELICDGAWLIVWAKSSILEATEGRACLSINIVCFFEVCYSAIF